MSEWMDRIPASNDPRGKQIAASLHIALVVGCALWSGWALSSRRAGSEARRRVKEQGNSDVGGVAADAKGIRRLSRSATASSRMRSGWTKRIMCGFALALAWAALGAEAPADAGADEPSEEVLPGHVFLAARQLHYELVALRHVLGQPPPASSASLRVAAASPRHVFFQAQVLFRKTHQLAEEVAEGNALSLDELAVDWRRSTPRPAPVGREVRPQDVLRLVMDSQERIKALLEQLNVRLSLRDPPDFDPATQPADVLGEILKIKRQLNRMMGRKYSMRNVYAQLQAAINYAGDLGGGYPPLPAPSRAVLPLDVHERLVASLGLVRNLEAQTGVQVIDVQAEGEFAAEEVTPNDVYDFATMVLGELRYMAEQAQAPSTVPPRGEYTMPRTILPGHVIALVAVLETQLAELLSDAEEATEAGGTTPS